MRRYDETVHIVRDALRHTLRQARSAWEQADIAALRGGSDSAADAAYEQFLVTERLQSIAPCEELQQMLVAWVELSLSGQRDQAGELFREMGEHVERCTTCTRRVT